MTRGTARRTATPLLPTPSSCRVDAIGRRVRVLFQPLDDELALPQFTLTDEPPDVAPWRFDGKDAQTAAQGRSDATL